MPKCGWKYTFVAPKEVSIHECTKKLYWTQSGPYGQIEDPDNPGSYISDNTNTVSSISTDKITGAPIEVNSNNIGNDDLGKINSYSVMSHDSRAYNKIPAQFSTCEYI